MGVVARNGADTPRYNPRIPPVAKSLFSMPKTEGEEVTTDADAV